MDIWQKQLSLMLLYDNLSKTLSKGKYAVFTHTGSLHNLVLSYDYIYGVWAMSSKFQLDNRESYEIYDGQVREYTDVDNCVLIYIPIK